MNVVIVGAGMVGIQIARELIAENRDVVLIEKNPETARIADNELDCLVINEDGSRPETLRLARADQADWFLALTGSDSVNIVACGLVAAESKRPKTIARVETPFYSALSKVQQKTFGLDYLINPAMEVARSIVQIIDKGFAESVVPLHNGALQLRMIQATAFPAGIGKTLAELGKTALSTYLVASVVRNNRLIVPRGDTKIEKTDRLYILGKPDTLDSFLGKIAGLGLKAQRILLVGSSRITERFIALIEHKKTEDLLSGFFWEHLFQRFLSRKMEVSLLEKSPEEGKRIAQMFQTIQVVQGDPEDEGVLESCGITKCDLCIASSESQSLNIVTAELAKELGVKKTISVVTNNRYLSIGPNLNIDAYVSSNDAVVAAVLGVIRKGNIRTIYSFYEDDVEIVELQVSPNSSIAGKTLKEIDLPQDVLVAFLIRNEELIVPTGQTSLDGGDSIALISRKKSIAILESIFGEHDGI